MLLASSTAGHFCRSGRTIFRWNNYINCKLTVKTTEKMMQLEDDGTFLFGKFSFWQYLLNFGGMIFDGLFQRFFFPRPFIKNRFPFWTTPLFTIS